MKQVDIDENQTVEVFQSACPMVIYTAVYNPYGT